MKRILCSMLAVLMLIVPLLGGCKHVEKNDVSSVASRAESSEDSYDGSPVTPALWKAEDTDGNSIYLFGSIHAADNAVNHLPDYFEEAYAECEALAFEIDISAMMTDLSASAEMLGDMMYTDGTTIKNHLSSETYQKLVKILRDNDAYNPLYDYYKPVMWESLVENVIISQAGLDSNKGVDMVLTNRAKKDGKDILETESAAFQIGMFNSLSDELIEMILAEYTQDNAISVQSESLKQLYEKWKAGTITAEDTQDVDESSLTEQQKALIEEYNTALLTDRNTGMADKIMEYLKSGKKTMVVVGAAHYVGEDGILSLLEEKGLTVTKISA